MQPPPLPAAISRTINLIVVHCSATPSGRWPAGTEPTAKARISAPALIDRWHADRGFKRDEAARRAFNPALNSIGYHYVIDLDGTTWTGRHLNEVGAHVAGWNANSVGICMVGGAECQALYTAAQWASLADLVQQLSQGLAIPLQTRKSWRGSKGVCGHRDLSPDANGSGTVEATEWLKTCPGFDVATWMGRGLKPLPAHVCEVPA